MFGCRYPRVFTNAVALLVVLCLAAACGGNDGEANSGAQGAQGEATGEASGSGECESSTYNSEKIKSMSWDEVVGSAGDEGSLLMYTSIPDSQFAVLIEAFMDKYPGVKLEALRAPSAEIIARAEAEIETGNHFVDVVLMDNIDWMYATSDQGGFAELVGPSFDAEGLDRGRWMPSDDWFSALGLSFGWGWNTNALPDGINSIQDFLSEDLANGRIAMLDSSVSAVLSHFYLTVESEAGEGFLEALAEQNPRLYASTPEMFGALGSGEVSALLYTSVTQAEAAIADGLPIAYTMPQDIKAWSPFIHLGIIKCSEHPHAAQLLADFIASPEGQEAFAIDAISILPGTESALLGPDEVIASEVLPPEEVEQFNRRFAELFQ